MKKILQTVVTFIVISFAIYFAIAAVLILVGKPGERVQTQETIFTASEVLIDYSNLPDLQSYQARDGTDLSYRYYPAESDTVLIMLHGSGSHSRYLLPLAEFISSENLAQVYTPDLRGHGYDPIRRGDVDYIGQLEDDLDDFIAFIQSSNQNEMIIIAGHSSGGGLAIHFAGSEYGQQADAYLLLAPYIHHTAPTYNPDAGWSRPYTMRLAGLSMLNNFGIHRFDYLTVIDFNMPEETRDGTETLEYSHRLLTSYHPSNYKKDLGAITQPLMVVAGAADASFFVDQYEPLISQYTDVEVVLLPEVTHIGVIVGPEVQPVVAEWLESITKP